MFSFCIFINWSLHILCRLDLVSFYSFSCFLSMFPILHTFFSFGFSCYRHGAYECYYYQPFSEGSRDWQEERGNGQICSECSNSKAGFRCDSLGSYFCVYVYKCMYLISLIMHLGITSMICPLKCNDKSGMKVARS